MVMKKQRLALIMLAVILLFGISPAWTGAAEASAPAAPIQVKTQEIALIFDGQELKLPDDQYSFIYQGRTYVPIRYLSYALRKSVGWDEKKQIVSIDEPSEEELVELKTQLLIAGSGVRKPQESVTLAMKPTQAILMFDGERKELPEGQAIYIYKGRIYVPVRFLAESTGIEIGWDPLTRTVSGESAAYRAEYGGGEELPVKTDDGKGSSGEGQAGAGSPGGGAASPGAGAGGGPGTGGGGVGPAKPTYEQITADARSSLENLRDRCVSRLMELGLEYYAADADGKPAAMARIEQELASCTAQFETLVTDVSAKLTANGYSTDIIAEYRAAFEAELEAGRKIAESLG